MNRMCFRPRPLKCFWRLKVGTDHSSFRIPFNGWWRMTAIGGGGGSGATHAGYADPSERGSNGGLTNQLRYNPVIVSTPTVGAGGAGGVVTNDLNFPPQRGSSGGDTTVGITAVPVCSGGSGGRCAAEATGLNPTQPSQTYTFWSGTGTTRVGVLLGVYQDGGLPRVSTITDNAGQGAAGRPSPPPASNGTAGSNGQIDFRLEG